MAERSAGFGKPRHCPDLAAEDREARPAPRPGARSQRPPRPPAGTRTSGAGDARCPPAFEAQEPGACARRVLAPHRPDFGKVPQGAARPPPPRDGRPSPEPAAALPRGSGSPSVPTRPQANRPGQAGPRRAAGAERGCAADAHARRRERAARARSTARFPKQPAWRLRSSFPRRPGAGPRRPRPPAPPAPPRPRRGAVSRAEALGAEALGAEAEVRGWQRLGGGRRGRVPGCAGASLTVLAHL